MTMGKGVWSIINLVAWIQKKEKKHTILSSWTYWSNIFFSIPTLSNLTPLLPISGIISGREHCWRLGKDDQGRETFIGQSLCGGVPVTL